MNYENREVPNKNRRHFTHISTLKKKEESIFKTQKQKNNNNLWKSPKHLLASINLFEPFNEKYNLTGHHYILPKKKRSTTLVLLTFMYFYDLLLCFFYYLNSFSNTHPYFQYQEKRNPGYTYLVLKKLCLCQLQVRKIGIRKLVLQLFSNLNWFPFCFVRYFFRIQQISFSGY